MCRLTKATEALLQILADQAQRRGSRLRNFAAIERRLGRDLNRYRVAKHFDVTVEPGQLRFECNQSAIDAEPQLDGIYVIHTMKTLHVAMRPIHVYHPHHVRGRVLLCMLAYCVEWHLRKPLKLVVIDDDDPEGALALRASPVAPAQVSNAAKRKN